MGTVQDYYTTKFNWNGPNNLGGTGDGSASYPVGQYFVLANYDGSSNGPASCSGGNGGAFAIGPSNGSVPLYAAGFCRGSTKPDEIGHEMNHITAAVTAGIYDNSTVHEAGT